MYVATIAVNQHRKIVEFVRIVPSYYLIKENNDMTCPAPINPEALTIH